MLLPPMDELVPLSLELVPLCPDVLPPPFIGVLGLFPQKCWREGLPHGDAGKGGCTIKGEFMDAVHGRGQRH